MAADPAENQYGISWHDSAWIPILNPENVLEYFSQRTNPFYDRTCNNEMIKMQRLDLSQLEKQHRHSPNQVTPLADYYILAGVVYQCPDLGSLINSRMLSALHNLTSAFDEAFSYARYHPSKGYWWEFKEGDNKVAQDDAKKNKKEKSKSAPSSLFQRQHVDLLLEELIKKFPPQRVKFSVTSTDSTEPEGAKETVSKVDASSSRSSQDVEQNQVKRPPPAELSDKPPPSKKRK
ncbi:mediator of RNA polymerase II transcription subunit 6-like isoform X2 [Dendronephthya gigantea]|uniref:mediator of RNA polymerase II transcription subunit 6-like isoform X2 n=1 Tax=Dendronephthya gigantea TaxID=151771 RepID=UPI00106D0CFC|nr:mediator of RNA polymerase II transcription subunit 6-like isoform X2 [Dendronephthya gigantea]